jgi:hypothetical protein
MVADKRPLPSPPDTWPAGVDDFRVHFGAPKAGWIRITLETGDKNGSFMASDVFDPFPDLRAWLEELTGGACPTLEIDQEGSSSPSCRRPMRSG